MSAEAAPVTVRFDVAQQPEDDAALPSSFNAVGMSGNPWKVRAEYERWRATFRALLGGVSGEVLTIPKPGTKTKTLDVFVDRDGELPTHCEKVLAEGRITFPDRRRRDQGNFRVIIEKALGDALVDGDWIVDDDWDRYEFGGYQRAYEKGAKRLELVLFPTLVERAADAVEELVLDVTG